MAKRRGRIAPPVVPDDPPPDPRDVMRGQIVPVAQLAETVNRWAREGYALADWHWLDGEAGEAWQTDAAGPRVYVWAFRE